MIQLNMSRLTERQERTLLLATRGHPMKLANAVGFTLIELIVTVAVAAILISLAIPSFQNTLLRSKLSAISNKLVASASLARSEAIKRNETTLLCIPNTAATSCATSTSGGWEQGWIVISNPASGTPTVIFHEQASPAGFKIIESGSAISTSFAPDIVRPSQNTWKVCRYSPSAAFQEKSVVISTTGLPTITTTTTGTCP